MTATEHREAARDIGGWRVSDGLLGELRNLDGNVYAHVPRDKLHIINTSAGGFVAPAACTHTLPYPCNWEHVSENMISPQPVLERLFTCLTKC